MRNMGLLCAENGEIVARSSTPVSLTMKAQSMVHYIYVRVNIHLLGIYGL
jgi:hypothetical protein